MDERIKVLADYYGVAAQLVKLCEECGELTTAAAKQIAAPNKIMQDALLDNLISELADVYVVSEQIKYLLGIDERVQRVADYKINPPDPPYGSRCSVYEKAAGRKGYRVGGWL